MASQRIGYLDDTKIAHSDLGSDFLLYVRVSVIDQFYDIVQRQKKHSNLGGCLHPDVIRRRDDANVGPPEVSYKTEQHPRGPRHGVGKGWVASNVI